MLKEILGLGLVGTLVTRPAGEDHPGSMFSFMCDRCRQKRRLFWLVVTALLMVTIALLIRYAWRQAAAL